MSKWLQYDLAWSERLRIMDQGSLWFRIAAIAAHTGDSWLWCGILFIFWLFASGPSEKIMAFWGGSIAVTACFVFLLKRWIGRSRPEGQWGAVYRRGDPYSFPSGHAVRAGLIVILAFCTFTSTVIRVLFLLWALFMIWARIAVGVHYLSDVIAGFVIGLLLGRVWFAGMPWLFSSFPILFDKTQWFK